MQQKFIRPRFQPLPSDTASLQDVTSLPDLIRFNARNNQHAVFCKQAVVNQERRDEEGKKNITGQYAARSISFGQVYAAVQACATWIRDAVSADQTKDAPTSRNPVALYMESDVGLFLQIAALMELEIPVLLLSARLGSESVNHLVKETGATTILVTKRTIAMLEKGADKSASLMLVPSWSTFFDGLASTNDERNGQHECIDPDSHDHGRNPPNPDAESYQYTTGALILHSSGTTGFPKPIYLAPRYILGYAACHEIEADEGCSTSLSTLPLYHGFGLLAPCLSLSIGMTCCFPPASIIPGGRSTVDLLRLFGADTLLTVPSIIEDILALPPDGRSQAMEELRALSFIAVGGGALKPALGQALIENGVPLVNHYGVTEIGAIAPVFRPGPDYDHRYLRLREDLGLHLEPIPGSDRFKLIGYPVGWNKPFEVQDELERNPNNPSRVEVRILGRLDDVLVLKTGEKVTPQRLESALMASPEIQTAICVGSGGFEVLLIVEPSPSYSDSAKEDPESFKKQIWKQVESLNHSLDRHGRISSAKAIILKHPTKPIPRSDKGSVMRREVESNFEKEITAAYAELETDIGKTNGAIFDSANPIASVEKMVREVAGKLFPDATQQIDEEEDFFERGMDSLQCVRLARLLSAALSRQHGYSGVKTLSKEFVYANPNIKRLSKAVVELAANPAELNLGEADSVSQLDSRPCQTRAALYDCIRQLRAQRLPACTSPSDSVVITGATGNLGAHVLSEVASSPQTKTIICLLRPLQTGTLSATQRLQTALDAAGLTLSPSQWSKIEVEECDPSQWATGESFLVDKQSSFNRIAASVTHIIHLAWPMDFHRTLDSFQPQIRAVQGLVYLARAARRLQPASARVRLVFASSIAVARNFADLPEDLPAQVGRACDRNVPEVSFPDPRVATRMGYAEAKWVCEQMLDQSAEEFGCELEPVVVRIGQLSGPESHEGVWKTAEHIPALVKASQMVGALPALEGTASWLPVDRAAKSLVEALKGVNAPRFVHLENPVRQPISDILGCFAAELSVPKVSLPFDEWLQRCLDAGQLLSLEGFFKEEFRALATGKVVLNTEVARSVSRTLRTSGGLSQDLIRTYVARWRADGFLV